MLEELDTLINFILQKYDEISEEWRETETYKKINQRTTLMKDVNSNTDIINLIFDYRQFLNNKNIDLKLLFYDLQIKSKIDIRVKAKNSIEYKINNYCGPKHTSGEVALNKCLNDLYGIRIIFKENVNHNEIRDYISKKYDSKRVKCIDSSKKEGYVATHIYFKKDNYFFQWELQIWDEEHEISNIKLHELYKQDYTKWEKENKGGESV